MTAIILAGLVLTGSMTNMEMLETAVADALLPVAEQVADQGTGSLVLTVEGEHEGSWLLEQTAVSLLDQAGITVLTIRGESMWTLSLRPMEMAVTYGQTGRSWFLGGRQVPRQATCQLAATLVDPDGSVVLTMREGAVLTSTVSAGDIAVLESAGERWVNGELSQEESGNLLEPLVVTGVVTALVYLFYSSRN